MTIIEKINYFFKKNFQTFTLINAGKLKVLNKVHFLLIASIIIIIVIVFSLTNFVKNKNAENQNNLKTITTSREFSNLTKFFFSKISSPYKEVSYTIKNNDTIEKILKNFNINNDDIKIISVKLRQKKLSNIYSGRKLSLIYKKLEDGSHTVVNLLFPINNTNSIEVRKSQSDFLIKENILNIVPAIK